jgi:hypothetical protein
VPCSIRLVLHSVVATVLPPCVEIQYNLRVKKKKKKNGTKPPGMRRNPIMPYKQTSPKLECDTKVEDIPDLEKCPKMPKETEGSLGKILILDPTSLCK